MIKSLPLWNDEECDRIVKVVKELRPLWISRNDQFHTLGVASYQDNPYAYPALSQYSNPIIMNAFYRSQEFAKLEQVLIHALNGAVLTRPDCAVPAFHIFDKRCNGREGSFHVDLPWQYMRHIGEFTEPMTFTVLLEAPHCGAGLNYWPPDKIDPFKHYTSTDIQPEVIMYERGRLYYHTGLFYHQIANPCDVGDDEYRITLQGHSVRLNDGRVLIYF